MDPSSFFSYVASFSRSSLDAIKTACGYGDGYSVQQQGFLYKRVERGVSADFFVEKEFFPTYKNTLIKVYEAYICLIEKGGEEKPFEEQRDLVEKVVRQYNPSFSLEQGPFCLFAIQKIQDAVREIVLKEIEKTGTLSIRQNSFKEDLDVASKGVIHLLEQLFEETLKQEITFTTLEEAFRVAEKMSHSRAGVRAFCRLAEEFLKLNRSHLRNAIICLNAIDPLEYESSFIKEEDLFVLCEAIEERDLLFLSLQVSHKEIKKILFHFHFVRYTSYKEWEKLSRLIFLLKEDPSLQKEFAEKVVDYYLKASEMSLKPRMSLAFTAAAQCQDPDFEKIIELLFTENQEAHVLLLLSMIKEKTLQEREYITLIDRYLKQELLAKAMPLIPLLKDEREEIKQYRKIIQYHLNKKAFVQAAICIARITREDSRKEEYRALIEQLLAFFTFIQQNKTREDCRFILKDILSYVKDKSAIHEIKTSLSNFL